MRKIAHISDVHFGKEDGAVVELLVAKLNEIEPNLIVVSGDLTQRAKSAEFRQARAFLDRLPFPQIVVPGNHDVPMYNVFDRFVHPLEKYRKYITEDLQPFFSDDEIAVAGTNTARSLTIKGGRISREQVAAIREKMEGLDKAILKVIVTHHPFDVPDGGDEDDIVQRAEKAMTEMAECGADVFLAGHLHVSSVSDSARRYKLENGHSALIIQAGTAASIRERGEENSFNILEFEDTVLVVKRFQYVISKAGFYITGEDRFVRHARGWSAGKK